MCAVRIDRVRRSYADPFVHIYVLARASATPSGRFDAACCLLDEVAIVFCMQCGWHREMPIAECRVSGLVGEIAPGGSERGYNETHEYAM